MGTNNALVTDRITPAEIMERVLIVGDLAQLDAEERARYYNAVCASQGLNPLTRPFEYITLDGRLTLYARRDAADQLRKIHGVAIEVIDRETTDGVHIVTVKATDRNGRVDEEIGVVALTYPPTRRRAGGGWEVHPLAGKPLAGETLANALMKATTKAKRRVTLSLCGLGFLDETEIEDVQVPDNTTSPRPTGRPDLRVIDNTSPPPVFAVDVPTFDADTSADTPPETVSAPTRTVSTTRPTAEIRLGWPTGPLGPDPDAEPEPQPPAPEPTETVIPVTVHQWVESAPVEPVESDPVNLGGALGKQIAELGANVMRRRQEGAQAPAAEPIRDDTADILAAQPIIAALGAVAHRKARLTAAYNDTATRRRALSDGAKRIVDAVYRRLLAEAKA